MLSKLASSISHKTLAKLIDLGTIPPAKAVVEAARSRERKLQVVTIISKYEPWEIDVERLNRLLEQMAAESRDEQWITTPKPDDEPTVIDCIMQAAPAADARAISMKQLARLAGYSYTQWFRDYVNTLVDQGRLVIHRRGFRRAT